MYAEFVGSIMGLFENWRGQQGSISWFRAKHLPLALLLVSFVRDVALNLLYNEVSFDLQNHKFVVTRFFIYIALFVVAVGIIVVVTRLEPEAAEPVDLSLEKEDADLTDRFDCLEKGDADLNKDADPGYPHLEIFFPDLQDANPGYPHLESLSHFKKFFHSLHDVDPRHAHLESLSLLAKLKARRRASDLAERVAERGFS